MIYDWTDDIFKWNGWHVIKWIFGVLCLIGIIYIVVDWNGSKKVESYLKSNAPSKILDNF